MPLLLLLEVVGSLLDTPVVVFTVCVDISVVVVEFVQRIMSDTVFEVGVVESEEGVGALEVEELVLIEELVVLEAPVVVEALVVTTTGAVVPSSKFGFPVAFTQSKQVPPGAGKKVSREVAEIPVVF
jgi:hypothetical protein